MENKKRHVVLRRCEDYDLDRLTAIQREILHDLAVPIHGRVFVKPNIVTANRAYIHDSYTHPHVVEAMLINLADHETENITIGESSGFGIPSRLFFHESGYTEMAARRDVRLLNLNEDRLQKVELKNGRHHRHMLLSEHLSNADVKIWMPKLKYHIFASITHALKLNIGILVHKERMLYHDHRIHEKIVDLLETGMPDIVLGDAVNITYGFESAPYPVRLGVLIGANDPLAADVVAAHIMGYRPEDVKHLKIASERGYGSLNVEDIEITGDITMDELRDRPKGQRRLFQVLSELDTPITFYNGKAEGTDEICDGGCEGALKGCLGTIEKRRPGSLKNARPGAIVTGVYEGDVLHPEHTVLMIGRCTRVEGRLEAKRIVRIQGCPTAARDLFVKVPLIFRLPSPMFDFRDALLFIRFTLSGWIGRLLARIIHTKSS